jgi:PTH1 family peptidyl-tRNA hydrolase
MKLYVGLGNPGRQYENTRHNVGFKVLKAFAEKTGLQFDQRKFKARYGRIVLNGEEIICLLPQTYMNLSGEAVRDFVHYFKIDIRDILVVYDDMDLPCGRLRLRQKGSAGGHNGMKSILSLLNSEEIKRMRVGVSRPEYADKKDYVLGKFSPEEKKIMKEAFDRAAQALIDFSSRDFSEVMNVYNTKE